MKICQFFALILLIITIVILVYKIQKSKWNGNILNDGDYL